MEIAIGFPVNHVKEFCLYPKSTENHHKILSNGGWAG